MLQLAWLEEQWNVPNRDHYYSMQVACEIRRVLSKNPNVIKLQDFKLKFGGKAASNQPKISREEASRRSKARWFSAVGMKITPDLLKPIVGNEKDGHDNA